MSKIVILCNTYYKPHFGGIEGVLFSLSKALQKRGYEPIIVCSNLDLQRQPTLQPEEIIDGIRVVRFHVSKPRAFLTLLFRFEMINRYCETIKDIVFKAGADTLVIAREHLPAYAAARIKPESKIKVIYIPPCIRTDYELKNFDRVTLYTKVKLQFLRRFFLKFIQGPFDNFFQKEALLNVDYNFLPSELFVRQFLKFFKTVPKDRYVVRQFGVDIERFIPYDSLPVDRRSITNRREPGIKRVFVFLGRLTPQKGLVFGLQAFAKLKQMDFQLIIIGDGPLKSHIEKQSRELGIYEKIVFIGNKLDPENYLTMGDVLFYPNVYESFGNTLVEGMACGLPVVCFKHKPPVTELPNEEIVENQKTGWIVEPDVDIYAEQLKKIILMDDAELKIFQQNAREVCEKNFSWDAYVNTIIETFKSK